MDIDRFVWPSIVMGVRRILGIKVFHITGPGFVARAVIVCRVSLMSINHRLVGFIRRITIWVRMMYIAASIRVMDFLDVVLSGRRIIPIVRVRVVYCVGRICVMDFLDYVRRLRRGRIASGIIAIVGVRTVYVSICYSIVLFFYNISLLRRILISRQTTPRNTLINISSGSRFVIDISLILGWYRIGRVPRLVSARGYNFRNTGGRRLLVRRVVDRVFGRLVLYFFIDEAFTGGRLRLIRGVNVFFRICGGVEIRGVVAGSGDFVSVGFYRGGDLRVAWRVEVWVEVGQDFGIYVRSGGLDHFHWVTVHVRYFLLFGQSGGFRRR